MPLFYTGRGDKGESFVGKNKIDKASAELEALGDLDELNSLIGLIRAQNINKEFEDILIGIQENLFTIQASLAEFMMQGDSEYPYKAPELNKKKIAEIEKIIDNYEVEVGPSRKFVIPGSSNGSSWLDYARAVSRRSERSIVKYSRVRNLAPEITSYMNRLSSLLYAMARTEAKRKEAKEENPKYK